MGRFGKKTREARLRWFGRMIDDGYVGIRILRLDLTENRKRGRSERRYMDAVREEMAVVEVTEEDAENRAEWR